MCTYGFSEIWMCIIEKIPVRGQASYWKLYCYLGRSFFHQSRLKPTLPGTNIAPENGWLEYYPFLLGYSLCSGATNVSFREGIFKLFVLHQESPTVVASFLGPLHLRPCSNFRDIDPGNRPCPTTKKNQAIRVCRG